MSNATTVELDENASLIGFVINEIEQTERLGNASQVDERLCQAGDGRSLFRSERTSSAALTVPRFNEPAMRNISSQWLSMRSVLICWQASLGHIMGSGLGSSRQGC